MIQISEFGEVTRFDLARALPGGWRYWTTAYLVDGLLVDTGCAHCSTELVQALSPKGLRAIANTHSHEDHIGANGALQRLRAGVGIYAHPLALPVLADPHREQPLHPYRRVFWGWPEASIGTAVRDGETISVENGVGQISCFSYRVIYTPGHSPDHLCLFEPDRGWLFSGDLFVGGRDRALRAGCNIWQIIESLKRVAQLPITCLFPGSARVRENPKQEILDKITYYQETGGTVLDMYRKGWSERAILQHVCGRTLSVEWITLGHFSRRHLIKSYLERNPANQTTLVQ